MSKWVRKNGYVIIQQEKRSLGLVTAS